MRARPRRTTATTSTRHVLLTVCTYVIERDTAGDVLWTWVYPQVPESARAAVDAAVDTAAEVRRA